MNNRQLGIAVVGAGRIGTLRANMASRHPSLRFLAVSDVDEQRATALAKSVGAHFASGDNYDVIAHPDVDAVFVSTPEHAHAEPILQAVSLGKPVFVEKPLCLSLEDADRVYAAATEAGVEVVVGYSRRHDRQWMMAREQVAQGRLGEVQGIAARVYNTRAQMLEILKRSPEATPVLDALTYYVDMACWFMGDVAPVEVVARSTGRVFREMGYEADDLTFALITHANGAVANLDICYSLPARYLTYGQSARFEVLGTDGVILLDMDHKDSVLFTDRGVPHAYVPDHQVNMLFMQTNSSGDWALGDYWGPIANETRSWLDHLVTGRPTAHTTMREGRRTLEVTLAIEQSAHTGLAVQLSGR